MYIPGHFREERVDVMHDLIRRHNLATLVTMGPDDLLANHLPMVLDPGKGPFGALRCHVSRANSQWTDSNREIRALAVFQGPSAYISPSWYATKRETGRVVPTYNFAVVHAYGRLATFEDPEWLAAHVRELTETQELPFPEPWAVDDAPREFIEGQLKGIVGFEIAIERLEGKWKVSQNRPTADRVGVVEGLSQMTGEQACEMARLIPLE